jgi:hypothetical protein
MKPFTFAVAAGMAAVLCLPSLAGQVISVPSKDASTIALAMIKAKAFDTVLVAKGVYLGQVMVKPDVVLKAASLLGAALDGGGRGTVVTMGGNATLCGFEVRNGTIGVSSRSGGNAIILCRIVENRQSGILCIGTIPRIENNVIVYNHGSGIQGWNLSATSAAINHNTIAYNMNNGVSLGGNSNVVMECNIVAFNGNESVKIFDGVKTSMTNNDFFKNGGKPSAQASINYSADPKFVAPRDKLDFSLQADSPLKSLFSTLNAEIGARFTY